MKTSIVLLGEEKYLAIKYSEVEYKLIWWKVDAQFSRHFTLNKSAKERMGALNVRQCNRLIEQTFTPVSSANIRKVEPGLGRQ